MNIKRNDFGRILLACLAASPLFAMAAPVNLILNGGAEDAVGVADTASVAATIPEWTRADGSSFTTVAYGTQGGFPSAAQGALSGGNNFFAGGPNAVDSQAVQVIDVQGIQGRGFTLSGWFGGFQAQKDAAYLIATFLDDVDSEIESLQIGGVGPVERGGLTGLQYRSVDGLVPAAAQRVRFTLAMDFFAHPGTTYNDAYADELSFVTHEIPEPDGILLFGAALAILGCASGRSVPRRVAHSDQRVQTGTQELIR